LKDKPFLLQKLRNCSRIGKCDLVNVDEILNEGGHTAYDLPDFHQLFPDTCKLDESSFSNGKVSLDLLKLLNMRIDAQLGSFNMHNPVLFKIGTDSGEELEGGMSDEIHKAGFVLVSQGKLVLDFLIHFALPGLGYLALPGASDCYEFWDLSMDLLVYTSCMPHVSYLTSCMIL
jgi:hypothetical protein